MLVSESWGCGGLRSILLLVMLVASCSKLPLGNRMVVGVAVMLVLLAYLWGGVSGDMKANIKESISANSWSKSSVSWGEKMGASTVFAMSLGSSSSRPLGGVVNDGDTVQSMVVGAGWADGPKLLLLFSLRMLVELSNLVMASSMPLLTRWISLSASSRAFEMSSSCERKRAGFGGGSGISLVFFVGGSRSLA